MLPGGGAGGAGRDALRQIGAPRLAGTAAILLVAILLARFGWSIPIADFAERDLYDIRATLTAPRVAQDGRIVLVAYNDGTLRQLQKRSPLDRAMLAKALTAIDAMHPAAIGIDILIDQPQAEDAQLIGTLRAMRTPTYVALATATSNAAQMDYEQERYLRSFQAQLAGSRAQPTSIFSQVDRDNVVREWPIKPRGLPPLLADAMTQTAKPYRGAIAFRLPRNADSGVFTELPIELFADPAIAPSLASGVSGRYVLIGGDIHDIDQFATPDTWRSGDTTIGLAVHAHMLAQRLDGRLPARAPPWTLWLAALIVVAAAGISGIIDVRVWLLGAAVIVQLAAILLAPFGLAAAGVDTIGLPAFGWGAGWIIAFAAVGAAARAVGSQQRRFAEGALGKYLPVDIANQILRDPSRLALHGEKREIYALFSDLEGFTKLSHAIAPETVATLLNRYLDMLSDIVLAHGGTIDKFVGDAMVAFWGAPIARPDDADRAVRAAIAIHEAGEAFRRDAPADVPPLGRTRVGLHRGDAIVGNFGGEGRIQYTALGDSMNTASRLESANKQLGTSVLVSSPARAEATLDLFRPIGRVSLSGRVTPCELFEPVPGITADERARVESLFRRFDAGDLKALDELAGHAAGRPGDAALANMVYRLGKAGPGGSYVLDHK